MTKKHISYLIFYISYLICGTPLVHTSSAQSLTGTVQDKKEPLVGANVFWLGTKTATQTDADGRFTIARAKAKKLVISFVGYRNDTLNISNEDNILTILQPENQLEEVVIRSEASVIDRLNPIQTEIITTKALAKAACCNLSESFETNASVSVSFNDAVTGSKQIQMLGLSGNYVQMNVENIPNLRGLGSTFGLNYIPGTWVQSIDIAKGVGSVVNGYESMTGAINVELQKPDLADKLYLNVYGNSFGRAEMNLNLAQPLTNKLSSGLLLHASTLQNRMDNNKDNFLDLPLYQQFNAVNRWQYKTEKMMAQFGIKALYEDRTGGDMLAGRTDIQTFAPVYSFTNKTNRVEFFSKTAKLFPQKPYKGLGFILNGTLHDSKSVFGFKAYDGKQNTVYANLIYQNIFGNTNHSYKLGASYLYDDYDESYTNTPRQRTESVKGVFGEYTYVYPTKFTAVLGGRLDFHNLFGEVFTPRLHLKYDFNEKTTLRLAAGKGFRVPNPLAENFGSLVSSRHVNFLENLLPERSWNYGVSLSKEFQMGDMKGNFVGDFYRTDFQNQLIVDAEHFGHLYFYNLDGKSFSNSFQAEINLVPKERLEFKLAYRYFDVQTAMGKPYGESVLLPKMFISPERVLFNAAYALPYDKWKWDFTVQWNGKKRIPLTASHSSSYKDMASNIAPAFFNINGQITRTFKKWDLYAGGENLGNFTQKDPIIGASNPFGAGFDAGLAWGPITGRMIYAGMRYKIKN